MTETMLSVRVMRKRQEAKDICTFELVAADGRALPPFSAGAHVEVQIAPGLVRHYSLCNDASGSHHYLIGVLNDPKGRGGSRAMHEQIQEGNLLNISHPRNHFPLAHGATNTLLFAGGIGITPILCMAERLFHAGEPFELHYCARSADRTAFVERIRNSKFAERVHFHFDDGPAERRLDLDACLSKPEEGRHVYVCGPKGFMDAVLETARLNAWPSSSLHYEYFSAPTADPEDAQQFEVQLASTGCVVLVRKDQSVVQALAAAGVQIPTSCEQGVCGTCLTRVLEGEPDHRDLFLSPEEQATNTEFLPCCSRSKSARLVLDL